MFLFLSQRIGDRCFEEGMYESLLFKFIKQYS